MTNADHVLAFLLGFVAATRHPARARNFQPTSHQRPSSGPPTYAWASPSVAGTEDAGGAVHNATRKLQTAADQALTGKGFLLVDEPAEAEFIATWRVEAARRTQWTLRGWASPEPFFEGWSAYDLTPSEKTFRTLLLELRDGRSQRLLFRANTRTSLASDAMKPVRLEALVRDMTQALPSSEAVGKGSGLTAYAA